MALTRINSNAISGQIDIAHGGTSGATANAAVTNLLPSQTGNTGEVLSTDGTNTSWNPQTSGDLFNFYQGVI